MKAPASASTSVLLNAQVGMKAVVESQHRELTSLLATANSLLRRAPNSRQRQILDYAVREFTTEQTNMVGAITTLKRNIAMLQKLR